MLACFPFPTLFPCSFTCRQSPLINWAILTQSAQGAWPVLYPTHSRGRLEITAGQGGVFPCVFSPGLPSGATWICSLCASAICVAHIQVACVGLPSASRLRIWCVLPLPIPLPSEHNLPPTCLPTPKNASPHLWTPFLPPSPIHPTPAHSQHLKQAQGFLTQLKWLFGLGCSIWELLS